MWYEIGQALLWVGIAALVIYTFSRLFAHRIGQVIGSIQQKTKEAQSAYKQGVEESREE